MTAFFIRKLTKKYKIINPVLHKWILILVVIRNFYLFLC